MMEFSEPTGVIKLWYCADSFLKDTNLEIWYLYVKVHDFLSIIKEIGKSFGLLSHVS